MSVEAAPEQKSKFPSVSSKDMKETSPEFAKLTDEVLFGDIWNRPPLTAREKSIVTVTTLLALNRVEQLESHFNRALDNGATKDELNGVITHVAFYAGWPTAASGITHLKNVLDARAAKANSGGK
ncbi:MAG: carboxymuconolactone decarboxylase family protein [Proteobacteria bacterium]|nr:MAG: carboxymuconolactone decarboxylase family protein [Pseudomonadota bacterium]